MNIINTDEHPRIANLPKKYENEKNKKNLIKKEKAQFVSFLKDTNKIIVITSLLMLVIQTAIPNYILKGNLEFNLLEFKGDVYTTPDQLRIHMKLIDRCHMKLKDVANTYKGDPLWRHYYELSGEYKVYDVESVKDQIRNCIIYCLSPMCPTILSRISDYFTFLHGSSGKYTKDEWPIFKPLRNNHMVSDIDSYIQERSDTYSKYLLLNYNSHPVENIALITGLQESKDMLIHQLLHVPISDIMMNKAFITLFRICVSHYGVAKHEIPIVDLHIERFLHTSNDVIRTIFEKHGWKPSNQSGEVSYNILRTKIIPDILGHYNKDTQSIESCYSDSEACNKFIHININNYDLSLLCIGSKRIYSYTPPIIYPTEDFSDLSDNIKKGLFSTYCKDPVGMVTKKYINSYYLWNTLLHVSGEIEPDIPDDVGMYEHNMPHSEESFKDILLATQSNYTTCERYKKPISYTLDDYNISLINVDSEETILSLFRDNLNLRLQDDNPVLTSLQVYIDGTRSGTTMDIPTMKRTFDTAFSTLDASDLYNIIARFVSISDPTYKKRFENIFINTSDSINISDNVRSQLEGTKQFRYKKLRESDIERILEVFTNDSKLSGVRISDYIYRITTTLARLKNMNTTMKYSSTIPKNWGLSQVVNASLSEYSEQSDF